LPGMGMMGPGKSVETPNRTDAWKNRKKIGGRRKRRKVGLDDYDL